MNDKIVKVIFKEGWETMYNSDLTQEDFGLVLQIKGITLPDGNVEVHFSLTEHNGEAPVHIGTVKDNVITVNIPDFILAKENEYNSSYEAYAWIYVTDGESGRTIRKIVFTIATRAKSTTNVPEDQKDKFLQEVRQVLTETKEVADSVRTDADNGKFNGKDGDKGDTGKSAYEYAVEGGYTGTEAEFMEGLARAGDVITKEEHEAELLKAMVKVTTDKAPFHHITDSANMKVVDFGMEGITEQPSTEGKNYYSGGDVSGTQVKVIVLEDLIPAGTYTVSANVSSSDTDKTTRLIKFYYEDGNSSAQCYLSDGTRTSATVTFESSVSKIYFYASNTSASAESGTFAFTDIQIEPGEVATDYEPYTNGPSPNPSYPQEIELAGVLNEETGRYEHKCCVGNKNLWDAEYAGDMNNWVAGSELGWYDCIPIRVPKGATISFSYQQVLSTGLGLYVAVTTTGKQLNVKWLYHSGLSNLITNSVSMVADSEFIYLHCSGAKSGSTLNNFMQHIGNDLQIEIADAPTELEPHASQPFTLTSPVPITKWDKLVKRDGVYGHSIFGVINADFMFVYQGTDETINGRTRHRYQTNLRTIYVDGSESEQAKCTHLSYHNTSNPDDIEFVILASGYIYIYFYEETGIDTLEKANQWLSDKRASGEVIEFVYVTDTEQAFIPLPDEEQELLHNLETYYGVTNVWSEQGCKIRLTYAADQELHWNQKLLEIQQAII